MLRGPLSARTSWNLSAGAVASAAAFVAVATDRPVAGWIVSGPNIERSTVRHVGATGGVLCCAD